MLMKTYLRHKIQNVVDIKGLVALEYLDFEGKYGDYVESHDFWEIVYIDRGQIIEKVENDPNYNFLYNYWGSLKLANDIKKIVITE